MKKDYPEVGDLVVCTVKNIKDFGVIVTLDEYDGKEGFIHISEISSGWIKYIRDYVREGQRIVCKVIDANPSRNKFDLSIRRVNEHQKREKLKEWKEEQRALKIIENFLQQKGNLKTDDVVNILTDKFNSLNYAVELALLYPDQFLKEAKGWTLAKEFVEYVKSTLKPPEVKVSGIVTLQTDADNGIELIKKALLSGKEEGIEISYVGAPKYRIVSVSTDVKEAEERMREAAEKIINMMKKLGGIADGPVKE
ncbi:MAG: translation initiation factor IF-2 subunit alpha [Thermoplasmatales archaeon]